MAKKPRIIGDLVPPQAVHFEEVLLGCILLDSAIILPQVITLLKPECFYKLEHQHIYKAILSLNNKDKPIDMITVCMELEVLELSNEVGGAYTVSYIADKASFSINLDYYKMVIYQTFIQRKLIELFHEKSIDLYKLDANVDSIIQETIETIEELTCILSEKQCIIVKDTIETTIVELQEIYKNPNAKYIKTGNELIDKHAFIQEDQIIGIAAPASAGKTSFVIKLMKGINDLNDNIASLWFSFEDNDKKILRAFAAIDTGISTKKMTGKKGVLSTKEMDTIIDKMKNYLHYDIQFVTESKSMNEIKMISENFMKKRQNKHIVIVLDNIMLIQDLIDATGNQTQIEDSIAGKISGIVKKATKNNIKCTFIFLHHMTKEMESRGQIEEGYRPKLSHMKGSTRFADIVDISILLNKPGKYKDLIKRHSELPPISCINSDGTITKVNRKVLLENMIIAELAKNRDGELTDELVIERYITQIDIMKFQPLKCIK